LNLSSIPSVMVFYFIFRMNNLFSTKRAPYIISPSDKILLTDKVVYISIPWLQLFKLYWKNIRSNFLYFCLSYVTSIRVHCGLLYSSHCISSWASEVQTLLLRVGLVNYSVYIHVESAQKKVAQKPKNTSTGAHFWQRWI